MKATQKALLLIVAMAMGFPAAVSAQTALNQVLLTSAITSTDQRVVSVSSNDNVTVGDVLYIDQEAMIASAVSTTAEQVTVSRGQMGTLASEHLNRAVVWTGRADRFYFTDPKAGRCTPDSAYPGGRYPWINVLKGELWECRDQLFGRSNATPGQWQVTTLHPYLPSRLPYTAIFYNTSRTADALVITPAYSARLTDVLIASLTYSGPFEVFLPNPTGLLGKVMIVSDAAGLNTNAQTSTAGRTITIRGLFENGDNTKTLANWQDQAPGGASGETTLLVGAGASTSFYVGITASSMYYWFTWK